MAGRWRIYAPQSRNSMAFSCASVKLIHTPTGGERGLRQLVHAHVLVRRILERAYLVFQPLHNATLTLYALWRESERESEANI